LVEDAPAFSRLLNREANPSAGTSVSREVDWVKLTPVFRVAEEYHLFPLDLAERVVLDDDNLNRQLILDGRGELSHQHGEAAVSHEGDTLPLGIGDLSRNGISEAVGHGGERTRQ
jgi:hypothetical protein